MSTDRMLASIADNTGMLDACQLLIRKNNEDDREVMSWVDEQCYQRKVDLRSFLYEVQQVVSIFQPGQENDEYYLTLGLEVGASDKEIKESYRELCLRYHPDTTTLNADDAATAFIEVNKAYQVLRNNNDGGQKHSIPSAPSSPHWRQENKTNPVSVTKKRRNIFWFSSLTLLMIVVSILAARSYQKKAMITGLQLHQAAFIPPNSDFEVEVKETPLKDNSALALAKADKVEKVAVNVGGAKIPGEELPKTEAITIAEKVSEVSLVSPEEAVEKNPEEIVAEELVVREKKSDGKSLEPAQSVPAGKILDKPEVIIVVKDSKKAKKLFEHSPLSEVSVPVAVPPIEVAEPEPTPEKVHAVMQSKIEHFLKNYIAAYENKDLETFSSFFDEYATENGKAINSVFPTYIELFTAAGEIIFDISILKWTKKQSNVEMDGRFTIRIHYKDGKKVKGNGNISFVFKDLQPELLIKAMAYKFDK
jgi:DnaJ-domain-containing protein 1